MQKRTGVSCRKTFVTLRIAVAETGWKFIMNNAVMILGAKRNFYKHKERAEEKKEAEVSVT